MLQRTSVSMLSIIAPLRRPLPTSLISLRQRSLRRRAGQAIAENIRLER